MVLIKTLFISIISLKLTSAEVEWSDWSICPVNTFVTGIRVNLDEYELRYFPRKDNVGISGIELECSTTSKPRVKASTLGDLYVRKTWTDLKSCPSVATGLTLSSHVSSSLLTKDAMGVTAVMLYCENNKIEMGLKNSLFDAPASKTQMCMNGQAICSIRTKGMFWTFGKLSNVDNVGLTDVEIKCCDVPPEALACTARDELREIYEFDNIRGSEDVTVMFEKIIGFRLFRQVDNAYNFKLLGSTNFSDWLEDSVVNRIMEKFAVDIGTSKTTGFDWKQISAIKEKEFVSRFENLTVKSAKFVTVTQVIGFCGSVAVFTDTFQISWAAENVHSKDVLYFENHGVSNTQAYTTIAVALVALFLIVAFIMRVAYYVLQNIEMNYKCAGTQKMQELGYKKVITKN